MKRVFISYSRRNKTFAERLARDLSDAGLDVWIDFRQIQGGELWREEIYRGIDQSDFLIACLSPVAVQSEWVTREILLARERNKLIIPVMAVNALDDLSAHAELKWLLDIHYINFEERYEQAFPELLEALPGVRRLGAFDRNDEHPIPNPFKGLEAFQQTDAQFFFGREELIRKILDKLDAPDKPYGRFVAVVGASGSGKSSLVRAGVIPAVRAGKIANSEQWPLFIFTPGAKPLEALATRLLPLLPGRDSDSALQSVLKTLQAPAQLNRLVQEALSDMPTNGRLLMVIDQFEEVFTRATETERAPFLAAIHHAATSTDSRAAIIITMRADFFDRLSAYPSLAQLFEQDNLVIVTEMTPTNLLRSIEGPAEAVGLSYEQGLVDRILADVESQPGSLPLLQYALRLLFERREGNRLTMASYEAIGGVRRALALHAESIYANLPPEEQEVMERVLLRLVEIADSGEPTRRRVARADITFRGINDESVQNIINLLTAQDARLLIASRDISATAPEAEPTIWIEVSHEALIREWDRFKAWVAANIESLRYNGELLKAASDWENAKRDPAYLLRGNRLARAEIWLESADATPLQKAFIRASQAERDRRTAEEQARQAREMALQRQAANRLRLTVAVLVVGLIVALLLTLDTARSRTEAENARGTLAVEKEISDRRADEARSLALAAAAQQALSDNDPDLGVALAIEANQISAPPAQSQRTLADVAYAPGTRLRLQTEHTRLTAVATSPDGQYIALGAGDGAISLRDAQDSATLFTLNGHTDAINQLRFSPNGDLLISASEDDKVMIWDVGSGTLIHTLEGHQSDVNTVAFSPDGAWAVSTAQNNSMIIWDVAAGTLYRQLVQPDTRQPIYDALFSTDGKSVIAAMDVRLVLWDVATGARVRNLATIGASATSIRLALNAEGTHLAAGIDTSLVIWSPDDGTELLRVSGVEGNITTIAFTNDGTSILGATNDTTTAAYSLRQWLVVTGQQTGQFDVNAPIADIAISVDGRRAIGAISDGSMRIWDITRGEELRRFIGHDGLVNTVAVHPNGRYILSGSSDGTARYWDAHTGYAIMSLANHSDRINAVAISPDGTLGVTASSDQTLILWDLKTGAFQQRLAGQNTAIQAVAISPDGLRLVSGGLDGSLLVWDWQTGNIIWRLTANETTDKAHQGSILAARFSPDGTRIASGGLDGLIKIWSVENGRLLATLSGHEESVRALAYNSDGTLLVSGGRDRLIIIWDLANQRELQRIVGHDGSVTAVGFTADDANIISSSFDGTIRLWDRASGFETRRYTAVDSLNVGRRVRVLDLALTPDGRWAISAMSDNSLRQWLVLPTIDDLLVWTFTNRYLRAFSCEERRFFDIQPPCPDNNTPIVGTAPPVPTATALPDDFVELSEGARAIVNTTGEDRLNLRADKSLSAPIRSSLERGTTVTLVMGPRFAEGFLWWYVRTDSGTEGWVVEAADGVQTLLPQ